MIIGIEITDSPSSSRIRINQKIPLLLILDLEFLNRYSNQQTLQSIAALPLPFQYHCAVTNPSLLHLIQLLQTEVKLSPQPLSQPFIESIATVLTIHILQHYTQHNL